MTTPIIPHSFCEPQPAGYAFPENRFCQINWEAADEMIGKDHSAEKLQEIYVGMCREWILRLKEQFGAEYRLEESKNFFIVSAASEERVQGALRFLEECLVRIKRGLYYLPDIPSYGKWPVLCLEENLYYEYLADFQGGREGEFAMSGGVCLNRGYGHFAIANETLERYANTFVHELTHGLLCHHALPLWLEEALAQTIAQGMGGMNPYAVDKRIIRRHQDYWNEERIQAFWTGESFHFPDEGSELSYHLALFLYHALRQSGTIPELAVQEFITKAKRSDAGHAACLEVLGLDLAEIVGHLLGEGNWSPSLTPPSPDAPLPLDS
jgi:hypothetical protein